MFLHYCSKITVTKKKLSLFGHSNFTIVPLVRKATPNKKKIKKSVAKNKATAAATVMQPILPDEPMDSNADFNVAMEKVIELHEDEYQSIENKIVKDQPTSNNGPSNQLITTEKNCR